MHIWYEIQELCLPCRLDVLLCILCVFLFMHGKGPRGGWVFPYMGHIGMCGPKGMVFQPFWSKIGYRFLHASLPFGCFSEEATFSSCPPSSIRALPSSTPFNACYAG